MATSKKSTSTKKETKSSGYQSKKALKEGQNYCTTCETLLTTNKFWSSDSIVDGNGLQHICIDCATKIFNDIYKRRHFVTDDFELDGDNIVFDIATEESFREMCSYLDIAFKYDALEQCKNHIQSMKDSGRKIKSIFGIYKSKLSSTAQKNSGSNDKMIFANSDKSRIIEDVKKHMYEGFEADEEIIKFWGKTNKEDLEFLESEWTNLTHRFECDTYSTEMLFQEIALTRLDIRKKREQGANVDKELKTLQDLLGSANIKPVQDNGSANVEQMTFGTLIKKYENTKPIPEPDDEFKDPDNIMKYISIWFFGHLCKMLGINNDYSKMYEEEMQKYRVEIDEENYHLDEDDVLSSCGGDNNG